MSLAGRQRRESLTPAFLTAAALHGIIFAALFLLARTSSILPTGASVPITIVANAPTANSRTAETAPETQEAQTDTPVPAAKAPSPPPAPLPAPAKPAAKPAQKPPTPPSAIPAKAKPTPPASQAKAATAKPAFSLDALQASIAKSAGGAPPRPASGKQGPTRRETAPLARVDAGATAGVSQNDAAGLSELLQRLWNPNCDTDGGDTVIVPVRFAIGGDGRVMGRVTDGGRETSSDPVVFAAARRAIDAVHQAEPYAQVYRGKSFVVNFDAKKACAER